MDSIRGRGAVMTAMKRMAWALPTVALVAGAVALANGFSGVTAGADLPAPIEGAAVNAAGSTPTAVDGENWTPMRTKGTSSGFGF
jgi:hypothetical protein